MGLALIALAASPAATLGPGVSSWEEITQTLSAEVAAPAELESALYKHKVGTLRLDLKVARETPVLSTLWGWSRNRDDLTHSTIVSDTLLDGLNALAGVAPRRDAVTHAGIAHTLGYLLSNLDTPFGRKRNRWTGGELQRGFRLPPEALNPPPRGGTLYADATYFLGKLALRDSRAAQSALQDAASGVVSAPIRDYPYDALEIERLEEHVIQAPDGGSLDVSLRTDLVHFVHELGPAKSSALLVYSVKVGLAEPVLQTAFPVDAATQARLLSEGVESRASGLKDGESRAAGAQVTLPGALVPIRLLYNTEVPGLDASATYFGERRHVAPSPVEVLRRQALFSFRKKDFAAACEQWASATRLDPTAGQTWSDLAVCLERRGQRKEAHEANLQAAIHGFSEDRKHAYFNLARLGFTIGKASGVAATESRPWRSTNPSCPQSLISVYFERSAPSAGTGVEGAVETGLSLCPTEETAKRAAQEREPTCLELSLGYAEKDKCDPFYSCPGIPWESTQCKATLAACEISSQKAFRQALKQKQSCALVYLDACSMRLGAVCDKNAIELTLQRDTGAR